MMSIFKRGKVYWFHFWSDGRHFQSSTKQGNPRVARQIESACRTRLAKEGVGICERKPIPVFPDAMRDFLSWSQAEHAAHPRTHQRYQTSSVALLRYFKSRRLDSITAEDVENFKAVRSRSLGKRTKRLLRPASVNRELACGKAMYNFVSKSGVLLENPFRGGRRGGVKFLDENNEQTRVLTYDEQKKYLAAASQPLKDIATLMLETGMRPEEVYRMERKNVHLGEGYVFNPFGKTKAARRKVNLTTEALDLLKRRLAAIKGRCLFPHEKDPDRPMLKANNAHEGALRRSGLTAFRLYDLRHTWATRAAMSGIDLVSLAAMLGHARIQMVLRYAHPTEQHQAEAMKRLEKFNAVQQVAEYEKNERHPLQYPLQ
jgi:integrase